MKTSFTLSGSPGGTKGKRNGGLSYKEALTGKLETIPTRIHKCQSQRESREDEPSLEAEEKVSTNDEPVAHQSSDTCDGAKRKISSPPKISLPSSSSPSVPSSPSPPVRSRWWSPRHPRQAFHGPGNPRGGWYRHFQHDFPSSSRMVFSAPHGVRPARTHHSWRGNINHHTRHRPSPRNRFYDSSLEVYQSNTFPRKVFFRPRSQRGETKSKDYRDKQQEKSPTPIVSIATAFNLKDEIIGNPPSKNKVSRLICFPTCTGQRESTVHFFPDRFSMPSYSFDMIFYQKLALVLGSKGKTLLHCLTNFKSL